MTPGQIIKFYELYQLEGIETALWPLLYYGIDLCKSYLHGNEHRQSMKRAFTIKCLSPVSDYMLHYSLLQFQCERWLFINTRDDHLSRISVELLLYRLLLE